MNVACCFRSLHTTFPPLLVETPCKSSVAEGGGSGPRLVLARALQGLGCAPRPVPSSSSAAAMEMEGPWRSARLPRSWGGGGRKPLPPWGGARCYLWEETKQGNGRQAVQGSGGLCQPQAKYFASLINLQRCEAAPKLPQ